jgi:hypothetical protein
LFGALTLAPVAARPSIDTVVMKNGDHFTCEIKKLSYGVLYVGFDYVDGTVSIDWSKVESLESKQLFRVETNNGVRYSGSLKMATSAEDQPRSIEILDEVTGSDFLERSKVVLADQFGKTIWSRFHGTLSTGLMYAKANSNTQYTLASDLRYEKERSSITLSYSSAYSNAEGSTLTTRNQLDISGGRMARRENWYYSGQSSFLQSSAQSIAFQGIYGAGIGRFLKNSSSSRILLTGGLGYISTRYSHRADENNLAGLIASNIYLYKFKKTTLTVTPVLLPSLTQRGRVRFNLNAAYNVQIFKDFWWNVSLYGNWDNRVPAGLVGTDYGTSIGITYSIH